MLVVSVKASSTIRRMLTSPDLTNQWSANILWRWSGTAFMNAL